MSAILEPEISAELPIAIPLLNRGETMPGRRVLPGPDNPTAVARAVVKASWVDGYPTILLWGGQWWRWTGSHWAKKSEPVVKASILSLLDGAVFINDAGAEIPWKPKPANTRAVLDSLKDILWKEPVLVNRCALGSRVVVVD
jgi:hypothetical protein